ncbi:hypothetical protein H0E87_020347 [Populus deltoides]|uniref:Wings apart-like protein C-terminal domain-containing protein n=1 Tax=Populus deltoides TaxID=3696 RepID=A0A8T2XKM4_POPDE|nr:hypothetical protein H0E87_020347 [Populus deltoides]
MIVRTYGRRNRDGGSLTRTYSDSLDDDVADHNYSFSDSFSLSQETTQSNQDFLSHNFPFSSQESTSYSLDLDPYNFDDNPIPNGVVPRKSKKPRRSKSKSERNGIGNSNLLTSSTTLMEAQEFGEMMEHVDEVNFALDGLKKGQPLRIKRASLLSLLGICGTQQQRRLLRAQGKVFDGERLLAFQRNFLLSFEIPDLLMASWRVFCLILSVVVGLFEVLEIKEMGCFVGDLALVLEFGTLFYYAMAKTIIDAILGLSFDDSTSNLAAAALFYVLTSDAVSFLALRKDSDILRDTSKLADSSSTAIAAKVQEILVNCKDMKSHSGDDSRTERPELTPKWIALLSMEKACLSKISFEDTSGMVRKTGGFKEKLREHGGLDAVFEVTMNCHSVIERSTKHNSSSIQDTKDDMCHLSLVLLLKCLKIMENATFLSNDNQTHLLGMRGNSYSHGHRLSFTKIIISIIKILSSLHLLKSSPTACIDGNHCSLSERSDNAFDLALINDDRAVDSNGVICISSSTDCCNEERTSSGKRLNVSQNSIARLSLSASSSETATRFMKKYLSTEDESPFHAQFIDLLDDSQDPYAFDEDDFQPTKWDLLSGKRKISRTQNSRKNSYCNVPDEEHSSLLADCLLTAIKVLMNLTNDNPIGCQQIAACGGLETMSSLIAGHFPLFSSSISFFGELQEDSSSIPLENQNDIHLTDQELDLLVAILGLLVNLVEKDGDNRSRLAATSIWLSSSEGSEDENRKDNDEAAVLQGEKEAEKMIVEAYSALLLAFLSTESKSIHDSIADCLPNHNLAILVPVLERFVVCFVLFFFVLGYIKA